jgi:hypothetical protein
MVVELINTFAKGICLFVFLSKTAPVITWHLFGRQMKQRIIIRIVFLMGLNILTANGMAVVVGYVTLLQLTVSCLGVVRQLDPVNWSRYY